jgi:signal peptidase I
VLLGVAVVLAVLLKMFVMQAFFIPSGSMEQTLHVGDRVIVNKVVYRLRDIHRGDVVVFNGLDSFVQDADARIDQPPTNPVQRVLGGLRSLVGAGSPGEKDFIKRVVGVPGDTVACCTDGHVTVNGVPLQEAGYVFEDDRKPFKPVVVGKGKIWVMGDHRSQSSDSRYNGQVPTSRVLGRAVYVVWPPTRAKGLRAPATFEKLSAPHSRAGTTAALLGGGVSALLGLAWTLWLRHRQPGAHAAPSARTRRYRAP